MKQHLLKLLTLSTLVALMGVAACNDDDDNPPAPPPTDLSQGNAGLTASMVTVGGEDVISIEGTITEGFTMEANSQYWLNDIVEVEGSTLTIQPGTTIYANPDVPENAGVYLLVNQGAKIEADGGDASGLIRFTSGNELIGSAATRDWGGLIIAGNANINIGETGQVEGVGASYGGNDDSDDSGTLRYVRIEYGGAFISASEDLNGLSLYGVGSGTTIDYVQIFEGGDDGVEFYGGTVDVKHLVVTNAQDDQFDYTNGWRGRGQFIAIVTSKTGDNGFEMDNLEGNETAMPVSSPQISNVTIVNYNNGAQGEGVQLRLGTHGNFHNMLVIGFNPGLVIDGAESQGAVGTDLIFANNGLFSVTPYGPWVQTSSVPAENTVLAVRPEFEDGFVGVLRAADGVNPVDASTALDGWFESTDYLGAADPDGTAWWSGWTLDVDGEQIGNPDGGNTGGDLTQGNANLVASVENIEGTQVISIEGSIEGTFTMQTGQRYWLQDVVSVEDGAVLTIEPNVTVYANPDVEENAGVYLIVKQGGQIQADGESPAGTIVFTSGYELFSQVESATRDWGGIILAGYGQINIGSTTGQVEGVDAAYGGTDNADNSGTLRYVRTEYGGAFISASEDLNGISFYGVGSGTTVEYVQVFEGGDDGVEFYGGAVDVKYLIVTNAQDDQIDCTNGWQGRIQYAVVVNTATGDNGIEMDNLEGDELATPVSSPQLSNITLVNTGGATGEGTQLRLGLQGRFHNILMVGYNPSLVVNGPESQGYWGDELVFDNSAIYTTGTVVNGVTLLPNTTTLASAPALTDTFVGVLTAEDGVTPVDASTALSDWFESTNYIGAADPSSESPWWTGGWAKDDAGAIIE